MNTIARTFIAAALATPVLAAQPVAAHSVVRVQTSNAAGFERFLPALPADVPWLAADRRGAPRSAVLVPEAGSVDAWMLVPKPAEAWSPLPVQSAGSAPPFVGL
jgi:hypothetical protein